MCVNIVPARLYLVWAKSGYVRVYESDGIIITINKTKSR